MNDCFAKLPICVEFVFSKTAAEEAALGVDCKNMKKMLKEKPFFNIFFPSSSPFVCERTVPASVPSAMGTKTAVTSHSFG